MGPNTNNFSMSGKFLPTIEIRSLKSSPKALQNFKDENPEIDILSQSSGVDEDSFPVDLEKLSKYVEFQLNIRRRINGKSKNLIAKFRKCKLEDFTSNRFKVGKFEEKVFL